MHWSALGALMILGIGMLAAGLFIMSWGGTTLGLFLFGAGMVFITSTAGAGLPRPHAVPRPGEEDAYDA